MSDDAANKQNAFDGMLARRRRFATVFAGETGNVNASSKLGLTGMV